MTLTEENGNLVISDVPIGKYGYLMDGTLFKVPENPLNVDPENRERMVILLYPGTVAVHGRRLPSGTPCRDAPNWNNPREREHGDERKERHDSAGGARDIQ